MTIDRRVALLLLIAGGCAARTDDFGPGATDSERSESSVRMEVERDPAEVVLFDGSSFDGWAQRDGAPSPWTIMPDGSVMVGDGDAVSTPTFGDFELHIEFLCPEIPGAEGQARANSGVYLHGRYEVQVLDSFGQLPADNGCGAVYRIAAPLANASRPPGEWQSYDIVFRAPRHDEAGAVVDLPRLTVLHNGVVIHDDLELPATTPGGLDREMLARGPILLQDHDDPVRYRNIRVRRLN